MFTIEEMKEMLSGINLKIAKAQEIYSEKIKSADSRGWEISQAYQNSIDFAAGEIKSLVLLRKKLFEEINKMKEG